MIKNVKVTYNFKNYIHVYILYIEVDLNIDIYDWEHRLNNNEKHFIKMVLAFFAGADGIVMENLGIYINMFIYIYIYLFIYIYCYIYL